MDEKVKICFDKDYKIKALDPVKFSRGEELEKECGLFVEKISTFSGKVNTLVAVLEAHAVRIDTQKLRVRSYMYIFLLLYLCVFIYLSYYLLRSYIRMTTLICTI